MLFLLLHTSFVAQTIENDSNAEFIVVLDAGHGGHDPGNLGNGYLEKNIALNIVLNVGAILNRGKNIKVIYTRKDDTFIDLFVRGEIANKANADLFVSVHCDSHSSDAHGAGTFVLGLHANKQNFDIAKKENSVIYLEDNYETRYADYDINSPESIIGLTIMQEEFLDQSISLAKTIQDNFSNKLRRKNREVKQAGFIVLHQTFMPSVLIETGFLTNDAEGAYLNSNHGQLEMGTAIARAILSYRSGIQADVARAVQRVDVPAPNPNSEKVAEELVVSSKDAATVFFKDPSTSAIAQKEVAKTSEKLKEIQPGIVSKPSVEITVVKKEEEVAIESKTETVVKEVVRMPATEIVKKEIIPTKKTETPVAKVLNIIFKVQLMASVKKIPLESSYFNGLNKLSKEPVRNLYRYMYGNVSTYKDARLLKSNADRKGYTTSYIVAYKDGVRIPTPGAIKMVSE